MFDRPDDRHDCAQLLRNADDGPWWRALNSYHWWVLIVATLGWLFDGMDQRIFILARTPALKDLLPNASDAQLADYGGNATAVFIAGWATGGLIFGVLGDRWGRTRTMMATIVIYSAFTGLTALAQHWWDFCLFRFLCGMGIGGEYAAGVALVAEVMPGRARPYALGSLQALGAIGNITGSALSLWIGPQATIGGYAGWRVLFLVGTLPALLAVVIRSRLREPESWLRAAERSVDSATGDGRDVELRRQLGDLREIVFDRRWRYHTIIGMILGVAGQVGLWGVGFWTPELIRSVLLEQRRGEVRAWPGASPTVDSSVRAAHSLEDLASIATQGRGEDEARILASRWKNENDSYVGWGTVLQDGAGMAGIFAFTIFTARVGRRWAFALSFLMAFGATLLTFGGLNKGADVFWMVPLLGFANSSIYGGFAIYFPELYPTRLRSTGTGFCYNVARYLTALGPLTLGKLVLLFGAIGYAVPLRPAAMCVATIYLVGFFTVPFAPETKGKPLPE